MHANPLDDDHDARRRDLFIRFQHVDKKLLMRLAGPTVGQREAPIIRDAALNELDRRGRAVRIIIVDLSNVTMLCSMGLGVLIDLRNQAKKHRQSVILYGMDPTIETLLRHVKISRLFQIARTRSELRKLAA